MAVSALVLLFVVAFFAQLQRVSRDSYFPVNVGDGAILVSVLSVIIVACGSVSATGSVLI